MKMSLKEEIDKYWKTISLTKLNFTPSSVYLMGPGRFFDDFLCVHIITDR